MNPTDQPPSAEAVKAALVYVDYQAGSARWSDAIFHLSPHIHEAEQPAAASARILAAHARAREAEVARLREALETIAANPGNLSDDKCRFASGDTARKALTGEASA